MPNVCKVCGWSTSIGTLTKMFCKNKNSKTNYSNFLVMKIGHLHNWEFLRIPRNSQKTGNSVRKGMSTMFKTFIESTTPPVALNIFDLILWSERFYKTSWILPAFWLLLSCNFDLLKVTNAFFVSSLNKTNRFHVAVALYSYKSQRISEHAKNISDTLNCT